MVKYQDMKLIASCTALCALLMPISGFAACTEGTTSAWEVINPSHIIVNETAAMGGSNCGLEVKLDGANGPNGKRYVQDTTPNQETHYRARFYFNPNGIPIASDGSERIKFANQQQISGGPFTGVTQIKLKGTTEGSGYEIRAWAREDNAGNKVRATLPIQDGPNWIETELIIGNGDGVYRIWVNNNDEANPDFEATNLNNAAYGGIDQVRLGYVGGNFAPTGSIFIDEFVSTRSSFIGRNSP